MPALVFSIVSVCLQSTTQFDIVWPRAPAHSTSNGISVDSDGQTKLFKLSRMRRRCYPLRVNQSTNGHNTRHRLASYRIRLFTCISFSFECSLCVRMFFNLFSLILNMMFVNIASAVRDTERESSQHKWTGNRNEDFSVCPLPFKCRSVHFKLFFQFTVSFIFYFVYSVSFLSFSFLLPIQLVYFLFISISVSSVFYFFIVFVIYRKLFTHKFSSFSTIYMKKSFSILLS